MSIQLLRALLSFADAPPPPAGDVTYSILGTSTGSVWPATSFSGSIDVGAAAAGKHVYALVAWDGEANFSASCTLDGSALTVLQQASGGTRRGAILQCLSPGNGSVAFSFSSTGWIGAIAVQWVAVFDGGSVVTSKTGAISPGSPLNDTVSATEGGLVLAMVHRAAGTGDTINFAGFSDGSLTPSPDTSYILYSAIKEIDATGTETVTQDSGNNYASTAFLLASIPPAGA